MVCCLFFFWSWYNLYSFLLEIQTLTTLLTAMNLTDFHDSALLRLDLGGPFVADVEDEQTEEYILVQISQTEDAVPRRRHQQQVMAFAFSFTYSEMRFIFCISVIGMCISWSCFSLWENLCEGQHWKNY